MKTATISIISFILGSIFAGVIAYKFAMSLGYQAVIAKLTDNVNFYRQIEQGKPELTQAAIESSLDFFIKLAQDGESSIWISSSVNDKQVLIQAKELRSHLRDKSGS